MASPEPLPSTVRERILGEHDELRELLAELEELIARDPRERDVAYRIRHRGSRFTERFLRHIALEDEILVPVLRDADAWGEERARLVTAEHAQQRRDLESLLTTLADPAVHIEEARSKLAALTEAITRDMAEEERHTLDPDVLRDDVVGIDVEAG